MYNFSYLAYPFMLPKRMKYLCDGCDTNLSQPIHGVSLGVPEYIRKISLYEIKQSKSQIR